MCPPHAAGGHILKQVPLYPGKYYPSVEGTFFLPGPLEGTFFPRSLVVEGTFLNITKLKTLFGVNFDFKDDVHSFDLTQIGGNL